MNKELFFELRNSYYETSISGGGKSRGYCKKCKLIGRYFVYDNLSLDLGNLKCWPLIFGGIYHTIFHQDVVAAFKEENITGVTFHPVRKIRGKALLKLPKPPDYYIVEPTGVVDIIVPWDEFERCDACGIIRASKSGAFEKPFLYDWDTWDGSDIVSLRNVYSFWICCNRKVIDLFRRRSWHHKYSIKQRSKHCESPYVNFGGNPVPGVDSRNIDSDTWYEDTMEALKVRHPKTTKILLSGMAQARESSVKREPKPLIVIPPKIPFAFDPNAPPSPQTVDGDIYMPDITQNHFSANFSYQHPFFGKNNYLMLVTGVTKFPEDYIALIKLIRGNLSAVLDQIMEPYKKYQVHETKRRKAFAEIVIQIGPAGKIEFDGTNWRMLFEFSHPYLTHLKFEFSNLLLTGDGAVRLV